MTLDTPTPEELEAEALDLERRADRKLSIAVNLSVRPDSGLYADAATFRKEAASKRAKAERMRNAAFTTWMWESP